MIMYQFNHYTAKELALAYLAGINHKLTPDEFILEVKRQEQCFSKILNKQHQSDVVITC
jgi:hypothetical protein